MQYQKIMLASSQKPNEACKYFRHISTWQVKMKQPRMPRSYRLQQAFSTKFSVSYNTMDQSGNATAAPHSGIIFCVVHYAPMQVLRNSFRSFRSSRVGNTQIFQNFFRSRASSSKDASLNTVRTELQFVTSPTVVRVGCCVHECTVTEFLICKSIPELSSATQSLAGAYVGRRKAIYDYRLCTNHYFIIQF